MAFLMGRRENEIMWFLEVLGIVLVIGGIMAALSVIFIWASCKIEGLEFRDKKKKNSS